MQIQSDPKPPYPTQVYLSLTEMHLAVENLLATQPGWVALPCDDPDTGTIGKLVVRTDKDGEQTIWFQYKPWGELVSEVQRVTTEDELRAAWSEFKGWPTFQCNDAMTRLVGIVCYDAKPGVARIIRMTLTNFKGCAPDLQALFQATPKFGPVY